MSTAKCRCGWSVEKSTQGRANLALAAHQRFGHKHRKAYRRRVSNGGSQLEPGADTEICHCPKCGLNLMAVRKAMALVTKFSQ